MTPEKNTAAGTIIYVVWLYVTGGSIVEMALGLSFMVLFPMLLYIAVPKNPDLLSEKWLGQLSRFSVFPGVFGLAAVTVDSVLFSVAAACVWFIFTMLLAFCGVFRTYKRGLYPAEETIIDTGLVFTAAGGFWLVLSEAGIHRLLPYSELTIALTAVHYHYSAVVVPVLTGAFGRMTAGFGRAGGIPFRVLAIGTAAGSPLIALGVIQGPPMNIFYTLTYAILLSWLGVWWLKHLSVMPVRAGFFIVISAGSLFVSMGATTLYVIGRVTGSEIVTPEMMFSWHGGINALGFSLFGVLGWYLLSPLPKRQRIGADTVPAPEESINDKKGRFL